MDLVGDAGGLQRGRLRGVIEIVQAEDAKLLWREHTRSRRTAHDTIVTS